MAEIALIYKELDEAEKYFMEALEEDKLAADSYFELSKISMIKGDSEKAIQFANIAIDIDAAKVVPKIKKDPIFIPVIARISIPFNINMPEEDNAIEENESKFEEKEIIAKKHLEDMSDITRNLSYDDIKMLKNDTSGKSKKNMEQDLFENQKERE